MRLGAKACGCQASRHHSEAPRRCQMTVTRANSVPDAAHSSRQLSSKRSKVEDIGQINYVMVYV